MQSALLDRVGAFAVFGIALIAAAPAVLVADEVDPKVAEATELAVEAGKETAAGNYDRAVELFRKARALDDRPEYVCNIGTALYRAKKFDVAHVYFELCLARAASVSTEYANIVRKTAAYIQEQLTRGEFAAVDVSVSPQGALIRPPYLPEDEALPGSRTIWLAFGTHTIEVSAPGYESQAQTLEITDRTGTTLDVQLTKKTTEPVSKPAETEPQTSTGTQPESAAVGAIDTPSVTATGGRPDRTPAWIAFIASGALLAGGGVAHGLAFSTRQSIDGDPEGPRFQSELRTFKRQRAVAVGLYIGGAVVAGIGAYLWLRPPSRPPVDVGVGRDGSGGTAVMLRWSGEL